MVIFYLTLIYFYLYKYIHSKSLREWVGVKVRLSRNGLMLEIY